MNIRRLSEDIVRKIAAGEVIERPASVVKELVENSVDAGAQRIEVDVKGAGRLLIRVADDGCGMDAQDLRVCIERHTTSKIHTPGDIDRIATLGFRGEALFSIAAVSRLQIVSRARDSAVGHRLCSEAGSPAGLSETGSPPGTAVEVRDLFWNTPARAKFLKSAGTEMNHIFQTVTAYCLARPQLAFQLREADRVLVDLAPDQNLIHRIQSLYRALGESWIPVEFQDDSIRVYGCIGHPRMSRADRVYQFLFVNGRPVKSPALTYALAAAYHSLLEHNRHPVACLMVEVDPESVDVNIHPAKREVRFHRTHEVQNFLREALRRSLSRHYSPPRIEAPVENDRGQDRVRDAMDKYFASYPVAAQNRVFPQLLQHDPSEPSSSVALQARPLAAYDELYWAVLLHDGFAFMDQHAAHERVLYERFLRDWRSAAVRVQPLLLPETVELTQEDLALLQEVQAALKALGFTVEEFGSGTVLVSQVPAYCQTCRLKDLLGDILDDLRTYRRTESVAEGTLEERIILRACKSAVKAHDAMTPEEIRKLLDDLFALELPYTCPHGRPTLIKFTASDLAKMFQRK